MGESKKRRVDDSDYPEPDKGIKWKKLINY